MAIDVGAYELALANAGLLLIVSVINSYRNKLIRRAESRRKIKERAERAWRRRVEIELNQYRTIFYRIEGPLRAQLGVDIRRDLEKQNVETFF